MIRNQSLSQATHPAPSAGTRKSKTAFLLEVRSSVLPCPPCSIHVAVMSGQELITKYVETVAILFDELAIAGGEERRDMELAGYMELAAHTVVGAARVRQLLYDFVHC